MNVEVNTAIVENPVEFITEFEEGIATDISTGRRAIQETLDSTVEWGDVQSV